MRVIGTPQLWWRAVIVLSGAVGLLAGENRIAYFTTQSNLITFGYFAVVLYWMVRRGTTDPAAPRLRGAITLWITITGLISHVLLSNGANPLPGLADPEPLTRLTNWSLFLMHYVVPIMVVLDWVMFGPRRVVSWRDLPLWILYPLGYGLTMELRAALFPYVTSRYPYFFLDPSANGGLWVAGQFVQLFFIFSALGALVIGIDRLAARVSGPQPAPAAPTEQAEPVQATSAG